MGKLQWQWVEAQESRKPARDANQDAHGEVYTSPTGASPQRVSKLGYLSSEGVPCSSHRALPVSAEGLGTATT